MTAQVFLLNALGQRYEKYQIEHKRCKAEFSEEAVHDLRVATRRLLAIVDMLRIVAPDPNLQKLRGLLKAQLDSLDELRDTQVMLVEISEMLESLLELAPFQKFLVKREKRLLKTAQVDVGQFKLGTISRRIATIRARLSEPEISHDLLAQVLAGVDDAFSTISRRAQRVDSAQPASIHRVRVAFKKFRYMLEIIYLVLPGFPEGQFKQMHAYQSGMGDIQDVEVFLQSLEDFTARHKAKNSETVLRFYQQRHTDLINAYIENMNEFKIFWREMPDRSFPWGTQEKE